MTDIRTDAEGLRERMVAWRRDLHAHPEIGFEEHRTAGIVAAHLESLGYRVQTGVAETGVLGLLEGAQSGPVVMFRFDMDALPVQEETGAEYASLVPGRMHACGHDGHVAIGMGLAEWLAARREQLAGVVRLVFQPAEEGAGGGARMVAEGVLENPRPDVFLALHIWNERPVGTIDVSPGPVMAAAEKFTCTVRGHGGHGAAPHQAIDPIVASAHLITALQTVVSRNVSPLETAVVTVGTVHGGDAFNVIPSTVEISGTVRSFEPAVRETVVRRIREIAQGVTESHGVQIELDLLSITPAVINDLQVTQVVREAAAEVVGAEQVLSSQRTMGSEDAAYFMQGVPGCYFFVGGFNLERELGAPHHNPRFDFDEDVLVVGLATIAGAAAHYLLPARR